MTEANGKVTQKRGNNMGRRESTTVPLTQSPFAAIAETEEDFVPTENSLSIYKESDTRVAEGKKIDVTNTGDGRKNEKNKEIATATVAKGEKENLAPVAKGLIGDIRDECDEWIYEEDVIKNMATDFFTKLYTEEGANDLDL